MTCSSCTAAQSDARHPIYQAGCRGCRVRALASGPAYFESESTERLTPQYRAGLQALFGGEWKKGHAEVKAERERLQQLKETAHG